MKRLLLSALRRIGRMKWGSCGSWQVIRERAGDLPMRKPVAVLGKSKNCQLTVHQQRNSERTMVHNLQNICKIYNQHIQSYFPKPVNDMGEILTVLSEKNQDRCRLILFIVDCLPPPFTQGLGRINKQKKPFGFISFPANLMQGNEHNPGREKSILREGNESSQRSVL